MAERKVTAPLGRPTMFSQELADIICDRISVGESVIAICRDDDMPSETTVYRWLREEARDQFRAEYARARENQADHEADEMKLIADDAANDYVPKLDDKGAVIGKTYNPEAVARSKLRWEDRRWRAGKLKPKVYGEKLDLTSDSKPIGGLSGADAAAAAAALLALARERRDKAKDSPDEV